MSTQRTPKAAERRHLMAIAFGERLEAIRTAKELTQRQLAELAGLSSSQLARFEKGTRLPDIEHVAQLAAALKMEPSKLLPARLRELAEAYALIGSESQGPVPS